MALRSNNVSRTLSLEFRLFSDFYLEDSFLPKSISNKSTVLHVSLISPRISPCFSTTALKFERSTDACCYIVFAGATIAFAGAAVAPVLLKSLGPGLKLTVLSNVGHLGLFSGIFFCIASSCPSPLPAMAGLSISPCTSIISDRSPYSVT